MTERWQAELFAEAERILPAPVWRYFSQGALEGISAEEAVGSWSRLRFAPRVLRDVTEVDTATTLLGQPVPTPMGIAPTSMQGYVHPDGEVAMARAAAAAGTLLVVPSNAGRTFADIAATGVHWWLQAYVTQDRSISVPMLRAAAEAGAKAVVLTVDTPVVSTRYGSTDPAWDQIEHPPARVNFDERGATTDLPGAAHARDLTPADIAWLGETTGLPVVVKGVLRADDARRAVQAGAAGIWVSNHGGRQLDRAESSAHALVSVVSSVGPTAEVYVDGGVRHGLDTLAALAAGARGVFLGRLPLLALAAAGEQGVRDALANLSLELIEGMRLSGSPDISQLRGLLVDQH